MRSKELELERTLETCRKLEWMKQQSDEKHTLAVRERDGVIQRLQTALHTHSKETEVNAHARLVPDINTVSRKLELVISASCGISESETHQTLCEWTDTHSKHKRSQCATDIQAAHSR